MLNNSLVGDAAPNKTDDGIVANNKITARTIRLIDENGNNLGEVPTVEARRRASAVGLDLLQVSAGIVPTVKILDLGRYRYDRDKAERASKKAQRAAQVSLKEVQLSPTTQLNDLKTIASKAFRFLSDGNEVKVVCRFEGRQMGHTDLGVSQINTLADLLVGLGCSFGFKSRPSMSGDRSMSCVLAKPSGSVDLYVYQPLDSQ